MFTPQKPSTTAPMLLTPRDAAKALALSERTLWSITAPRGVIPCVRVGAAVRYDPADLQQWIETAKTAKAG